ncbi:UDP-3-O-(3-hydroxymyristoyl)glucosamine N-acyltransferase [Aquimarina sp. ERC-38]|uniref:UDP-3-O-(3-hydroxymyristoyl)glucosamine N-acyltransferase n=1 Tax=Aquimarina sp. ERC-38 TaxID=2949996 RepID=UPI00224694E8|nr:UDP-3-O-(3-hydroxymyristoyl)glucosamine N-acyltransferase [Aquimarina sp. ERC-38]UZO79506.1 UDP-3-O-(3-hydroxymyristoyl)glucosamine N-acyltransferase [Aquimarina sp. ERC-38]
MKFPQAHTLQQIATIISSEYVGVPDFPVYGMNEIHVVTEGDIVFVDHPKYYAKALESAATIVLINKKVDCPDGKALLISDDPFRDFNTLSEYFRPFQKVEQTQPVSTKVGHSTIVQPGVFIGNNVSIGEHCLIHANVSIYDHTVIGDHVTIHAGTVIGSDAFYYKKRDTGYDQLKSGGRVVLKDKVHIGAGCTIDRGVTGDTTIGEGTKIDNQVHIGHDTNIGKKCLIASQVGIAGCVVIEDDVTLWGQVGVTSGITIGSKAIISAQSGISKSLDGGKSYFGTPADDFRKKYKEIASIRKIPEILDHMKKKK